MEPTNNSNSMSSTPNSFVSHMKDWSDLSNIEMVHVAATSYTSLRDLIPPSPPHPTAVGSPTAAVFHNSSWHEDIPIKNPLVKHAAIAYLQPMSTSPRKPGGGKGILRSIRDICGCDDEGIGCMIWLRDVVWGGVKNAFGDGRSRREHWD